MKIIKSTKNKLEKLTEKYNSLYIKSYKKFALKLGYSRHTTLFFYKLLTFSIITFIATLGINLMAAFFGKHSNFGEFGDFMGGVLNPALMFLTLMAMLMTITLQKKELFLARQEFKRSADALMEQSESLKFQRFESSFLILLERLEQSERIIKNNSSLESPDFETAFYEFHETLQVHDIFNLENSADEIKISYRMIRHDNLAHFNLYLSTIYCLLDLLIKNESNPTNSIYSKLLSNSLSNYGLNILLLDCQLSTVEIKYKDALEKFIDLERILFYRTDESEELLGKAGCIDIEQLFKKYS